MPLLAFYYYYATPFRRRFISPPLMPLFSSLIRCCHDYYAFIAFCFRCHERVAPYDIYLLPPLLSLTRFTPFLPRAMMLPRHTCSY